MLKKLFASDSSPKLKLMQLLKTEKLLMLLPFVQTQLIRTTNQTHQTNVKEKFNTQKELYIMFGLTMKEY